MLMAYITALFMEKLYQIISSIFYKLLENGMRCI